MCDGVGDEQYSNDVGGVFFVFADLVGFVESSVACLARICVLYVRTIRYAAAGDRACSDEVAQICCALLHLL